MKGKGFFGTPGAGKGRRAAQSLQTDSPKHLPQEPAASRYTYGCFFEKWFGASIMTLFWISYILHYSAMVAASFFLWRQSFFAFLAFFAVAYLPGPLAQKLDRPTERFKDECQASAPRYADALFKAAAVLFIAVFTLRGALGSHLFQGLLGAYAIFVLSCALRDIYLVRFCIRHWQERHR